MAPGPGPAWTGPSRCARGMLTVHRCQHPSAACLPWDPSCSAHRLQPTVGSLRARDVCTPYSPRVPGTQSSEMQQMDGVFLDQDVGGD